MLTFFILLLLHLPCFTPSPNHRRRRRNSSFFSFFKRLFSSSSPAAPQPSPSLRSPSSSTRSLRPNPTLTPDIHPCSACGEVFRSPPLLEHHRSIRHPISELAAEDENIVRIIFKTGWPESAKTPNIRSILKIHNSSRIVSRFEEHRERVRSRAAAAAEGEQNERCVADGNEMLRFHCTTFTCGLDSDSGGACGRQYCSVCGIVRSGFSPKMDGISTLRTSYAAHTSLPEGIEEEFEFMNVKRAVLVCRVIAGRVGCESLVADRGDDEDEIVVFNPRAVLPCFVIVYTTM